METIFNINEKTYTQFEIICKEKNINKNDLIQKYISSFIIENFEIENKYFSLINDMDYNPITIIKKEKEFLYLSDGNIINFSTFQKIYEETDPVIKNTLEYINEIPGNKKLSNEDFEDLLKAGEKLKEDFNKPFLDPKEIISFIDDSIKDEETISKEIQEIQTFLIEKNIEKKIHNLNDEVWDVTRIIKIENLKIIKDSKNLHCFIIDDAYNKEELKYILNQIFISLDVNIYDYNEIIFKEKILDKYRHLRGDYLINYIDLGPLISEIFNTPCTIKKDEEFYYLYIKSDYFCISELYSILFSNHIKMDNLILINENEKK